MRLITLSVLFIFDKDIPIFHTYYKYPLIKSISQFLPVPERLRKLEQPHSIEVTECEIRYCVKSGLSIRVMVCGVADDISVNVTKSS